MRWQDAAADLFFLLLLGSCAIWFAERLGWAVVSRLVWLVVALPILIALVAAAGHRLSGRETTPLRIAGLLCLAAAIALALWLVWHLAGLMISRTPLRELTGF